MNFPPLLKKNPVKIVLINRIFNTRFVQKKRGVQRIVNAYKKKPYKIWDEMTLYDLARVLGKDMDYFNTVLKPKFQSVMEPTTGKILKFGHVIKFLKEESLYYEIWNKPKVMGDQKKSVTSVSEDSVPSKKYPDIQIPRPPIVTIMGHVDHGKTTLLDALRNSNIVDGEFGGITQHIGAFSVSLPNGKNVTFIDTPGHAAFSGMRNRGAEVTDIVVLIVAADDGVMEQTVESIKMAMNAGVKILVAVNKIDKSPDNMKLIKEQLLNEGIQSEDLGGDVQVIPISALKRKNIDGLVDAILAEAEMMRLTGNPQAPVKAVVIESSKGPLGKTATLIVKEGTLRKKSILVAEQSFVVVRGMYDDNGKELKEVGLSVPAQVTGWRDLPRAGAEAVEVFSRTEAYSLIKKEHKKEMEQKILRDYVPIQEMAVASRAEYREKSETIVKFRESRDIKKLKQYLEMKRMEFKDSTSPTNKLDIILKGDVDGSLDAILNILDTYDSHDECKLSIVHFGVGPVTDTDIDLSTTFNATIYCFNVSYPDHLKDTILEKKIKVRFHNVIYKLLDDLKTEINSNARPVEKEEIHGTAEVMQHFMISEKRKEVPVAGSACLTGELRKNASYRVIRDNEVIYDGKIKSLKHFKNEVNTIKKGSQCGIMLADFDGEFQKGDKIICYERKLVQLPVSWNPGF